MVARIDSSVIEKEVMDVLKKVLDREGLKVTSGGKEVIVKGYYVYPWLLRLDVMLFQKKVKH